MADSNSGQSPATQPTPLDSKQYDQAHNIIAEQKANLGTAAQSDDANAESHGGEAVKDRIDDAIPKGPKKADQSSGGRVQVAETGDLHDLAARRHS